MATDFKTKFACGLFIVLALWLVGMGCLLGGMLLHLTNPAISVDE